MTRSWFVVMAMCGVAAAAPEAPVIDVQIETTRQIEDPNDTLMREDHVRLHAFTETTSGFYAAPVLELVLRGSTTKPLRMRWPVDGSAHRSFEVLIPSAGWWAIDVLQRGKPVSSMQLLARQDGCLGGSRKLVVETNFGAQLHGNATMMGEDESSMTLELHHHVIANGDGAAIVEWRRGGKVIVTEQVALSRKLSDKEQDALDHAATLADLDAVCPLTFALDSLTLPSEVRSAPGAWEARIYERDAQAYAVSFHWHTGQLRAATAAMTPIATPGELAYEKPADPAQIARAHELRAMLRSRDAGTAWLAARTKHEPAMLGNGGVFTDAEMPVPMTAHAPAAIAAHLPPRIATPRLPAISPDGKAFAIRDHVEMKMYGGQCHPPTGEALEVYSVENSQQIPSQDLSTFEPLACNAKLPAGLVVAHPDANDTYHMQIRDAKGAVILDLPQTGHGEDVCVSPRHHVIVVMLGLPLGGDCRTASGMAPVAARY